MEYLRRTDNKRRLKLGLHLPHDNGIAPSNPSEGIRDLHGKCTHSATYSPEGRPSPSEGSSSKPTMFSQTNRQFMKPQSSSQSSDDQHSDTSILPSSSGGRPRATRSRKGK